MGSLVPESALYCPPEVAKSGWEVIKRHPVTATDAYGFALLLYETFNGCVVGPETIGQTKNLPPSMHQPYKRLLNQNPKSRLSVSHFRDQGKRSGGFFDTPLIKLSEGMESLGLKSDREREEFLRCVWLVLTAFCILRRVSELDEASSDFPEEYFNVKVLPELLKSVEFGGGGAKVFASVMKISARLSDDEYNAKLTPVIVRLFSNPDRAIRVCLLDHLPQMIDHLPQKVVNDKIFPQMVTGFADIAPLVREQTVKAVLSVISKLSDRTINGELLKYLAKTSNDEQPGIRTNTTICLGKIARNLGANRVRKFASTLPDSALPPSTANTASNAMPRIGTPQNDTGWAGWAISSFTNKIATASGEMQASPTSMKASLRDGRSSSVPPIADTNKPAHSASSVSQLHRQAVTGAPAPVLTRTSTDHFFTDAQEEDDELDTAWGDGAEESFFDAPAPPKASVEINRTAAGIAFDDGGEPDFEGWLKAQVQAKKNAPLPKGLSKPTAPVNGRIPATRSTTTGHVGSGIGTQKLASTAKAASKVVTEKAVDMTPKESHGDDDWGDAWD
ncbi:MAG: hypothetical protein Q9222_001353 [Ikaeria aurantiellina]